MSKFGIKTHYKVNTDITSTLTIEEMVFMNDEPLQLTGRIGNSDDNKGLANAIRAKYGKRVFRGAANPDKEQQKVFDIVRNLFPIHVIIGWNVVDPSGNPFPYSPRDCQELLEQLSVYAIGDIYAHFVDETNFREALTREDGVEMGNTSGQ